MSNKAISVYATALKRHKDENRKHSPSQPPRTVKQGGQASKDKIERKKSVLQERQKDRQTGGGLSSIAQALRMKATVHTTFRYPQDLLDSLEEVQYQLRRRYKKKITKNAILVAALAHFLWNFEASGKESGLFKGLIDTNA